MVITKKRRIYPVQRDLSPISRHARSGQQQTNLVQQQPARCQRQTNRHQAIKQLQLSRALQRQSQAVTQPGPEQHTGQAYHGIGHADQQCTAPDRALLRHEQRCHIQHHHPGLGVYPLKQHHLHESQRPPLLATFRRTGTKNLPGQPQQVQAANHGNRQTDDADQLEQMAEHQHAGQTMKATANGDAQHHRQSPAQAIVDAGSGQQHVIGPWCNGHDHYIGGQCQTDDFHDAPCSDEMLPAPQPDRRPRGDLRGAV